MRFFVSSLERGFSLTINCMVIYIAQLKLFTNDQLLRHFYGEKFLAPFLHVETFDNPGPKFRILGYHGILTSNQDFVILRSNVGRSVYTQRQLHMRRGQWPSGKFLSQITLNSR